MDMINLILDQIKNSKIKLAYNEIYEIVCLDIVTYEHNQFGKKTFNELLN